MKRSKENNQLDDSIEVQNVSDSEGKTNKKLKRSNSDSL